ncbi:DNA polymerase V [Escherichia coli]|nr:DNA polymerase V [Escherichia coli]EGP9350783.1 DNA polymerase V [Escherichia coli]EGQ0047012.1 DNA polymerase V [Escherichia coli]EHO8427429.1 DNA polymerase V [Escherichia coli]OSK68193.1 hypothetical protein EADG_04368 [Escherichia coli E1114]
MARRSDIEHSFRQAIVFGPKNGQRTVTTPGFVKELAKRGWDMTLPEANKWIEIHVCTFKDISSVEGDDRTFMLFNPNGGL